MDLTDRNLVSSNISLAFLVSTMLARSRFSKHAHAMQNDEISLQLSQTSNIQMFLSVAPLFFFFFFSRQCFMFVCFFFFFFRKKHGTGVGRTTASSTCPSHGTGRLNLAEKAVQSLPHLQQSQGPTQGIVIQSESVSLFQKLDFLIFYVTPARIGRLLLCCNVENRHY